jgi:adhesin/invasin
MGPKLIKIPVLLLVAFTATLSAAPQLVLSSTSVGPIQVSPGSNGAAQTVQARNVGTGSLSLTATVSATWLAAAPGGPQTCSTGGGTCYPINIALTTAALAAGSYTGFVTVADPNAVDSPQQITVTVNVVGIPSSLTFYVTPSGGATPTAFVPVATKGTVTGMATTQSGGNWLLFTSGGIFSSGYIVQVTAQNGQAPGSYTGSVVVTGANPADNKTIAVTLNVTSSPIVQPIVAPVLLTGFPGGANATAAVPFTNIGAGTLNITAAAASSSPASFLNASVSSANTVTVTATPGTLNPGFYTGTVTITSNAANNSLISVPIVLKVEAAGTPVISYAAITNIANFVAESAAPGEILAVFGDQLAPPGTLAQNPGLPPLATTLGTVQVLVNGTSAPLYFVSPGQVNFQLPYEAPVGQVVTVQVVSNGKPGNLRPLSVSAIVPRLLVWTPNVIAGGYGIVVNQDFSLTLPSPVAGFTTHAAKPGDTITIYCVALGQTTPAAVTGAAAGSTPLEAISNVTVTFGGLFEGTQTTVPAIFAGLTPTAVGLYQVNVTIPANVPVGSGVSATVNLNGVSSNPVLIDISH